MVLQRLRRTMTDLHRLEGVAVDVGAVMPSSRASEVNADFLVGAAIEAEVTVDLGVVIVASGGEGSEVTEEGLRAVEVMETGGEKVAVVVEVVVAFMKRQGVPLHHETYGCR
jgi:hypothetical protein